MRISDLKLLVRISESQSTNVVPVKISTGNSSGAHIHINANPSILRRWIADLADGKFDGIRARFNVGEKP